MWKRRYMLFKPRFAASARACRRTSFRHQRTTNSSSHRSSSIGPLLAVGGEVTSWRLTTLIANCKLNTTKKRGTKTGEGDAEGKRRLRSPRETGLETILAKYFSRFEAN